MEAKTKTTLIVIGCILAVAVVAFLVWKMLKSEKTTEVDDPDFPLKEGSKGAKVRILQEYLNRELAELQKEAEVSPVFLTVDGIFGPNTATACRMVFGTETVSKSQWNEI